MGAGARLAEERGRWADHWRVVDLEYAGDRLLESLEPEEELRTAVPGFREREPHGADPVLIGVTDRRVLVVGPGGPSAAHDPVGVADVTGAMRRMFDRRTFTVVLNDLPGGEVEIDMEPADLVRLREMVDELGA